MHDASLFQQKVITLTTNKWKIPEKKWKKFHNCNIWSELQSLLAIKATANVRVYLNDYSITREYFDIAARR